MIDTWDFSTSLLYIFVILFTFFLAFFTVSKTPGNVHNNLRLIPTLILFFVFFGLSAVRSVGTDYATYEEIFLAANNPLDLADYGLEPGFLFFNKLVRFFTAESKVYFALVSFLTVFFFFKGIFHWKDKINVPLAILFFSSLYYFQSFSLIRAYLSSSILLVAFSFMIERQFKAFAIWFLLACTIHYSALLLFPVLVGVVLYRRGFYWFILYLLGFFYIVYRSLDYLIWINVADRYTSYVDILDRSASIGLAQFFIYLPVLILVYIARYKRFIDSWFLLVTEVLVWFGLLYGLIGYWFPVIGRVAYLITFPFIIFIPFFLNSMKTKFYKRILYTFIFLYITIRALSYFSTLALSDGINEFRTFF